MDTETLDARLVPSPVPPGYAGVDIGPQRGCTYESPAGGPGFGAFAEFVLDVRDRERGGIRGPAFDPHYYVEVGGPPFPGEQHGEAATCFPDHHSAHPVRYPDGVARVAPADLAGPRSAVTSPSPASGP